VILQFDIIPVNVGTFTLIQKLPEVFWSTVPNKKGLFVTEFVNEELVYIDIFINGDIELIFVNGDSTKVIGDICTLEYVYWLFSL